MSSKSCLLAQNDTQTMVGQNLEIGKTVNGDEVIHGTDHVTDHFQDLDHIPVIHDDQDQEIMEIEIDPTRETEIKEVAVIAEGTVVITGVVNQDQHLQIKRPEDVTIAKELAT